MFHLTEIGTPDDTNRLALTTVTRDNSSFKDQEIALGNLESLKNSLKG